MPASRKLARAKRRLPTFYAVACADGRIADRNGVGCFYAVRADAEDDVRYSDGHCCAWCSNDDGHRIVTYVPREIMIPRRLLPGGKG